MACLLHDLRPYIKHHHVRVVFGVAHMVGTMPGNAGCFPQSFLPGKIMNYCNRSLSPTPLVSLVSDLHCLRLVIMHKFFRLFHCACERHHIHLMTADLKIHVSLCARVEPLMSLESFSEEELNT